MWPLDKSGLVEHFVTVLSGEKHALDYFFALDCGMQAGIALAFVLAAGEEEEGWKQTAVGLLRNHKERSGTGINRPRSFSQESKDPREISVLLVIGGLPTLDVGLLSQTVVHFAQQLHGDMRWTFLPTIWWPRNTRADISPVAAEQTCGLSADLAVSSEDSLLTLLTGALTQQMGRLQIVFISIINHVPRCLAESAVPEDLLHRADNRWLWSFCRVAQMARSKVGQTGVCEIAFSVKSKAVSGELTSVVGDSTVMHNKMQGVPTLVVPTIFSNPSGFAPVACVPCSADDMNPIAEWSPPPFKSAHAPVVKAQVSPVILAWVAQADLFKEAVLTVMEKDILNLLRSRNARGESRLLPVSWFMRWYGYEKTFLGHFLLQQLPCFESIISTTGRKPPSGNHSKTTPCGQDRFCVNCEQILLHMSASFPIHLVSECALALLSKMVPIWKKDSQAGDSVNWKKNDTRPVHVCSDSCPRLTCGPQI